MITEIHRNLSRAEQDHTDLYTVTAGSRWDWSGVCAPLHTHCCQVQLIHHSSSSQQPCRSNLHSSVKQRRSLRLPEVSQWSVGRLLLCKARLFPLCQWLTKYPSWAPCIRVTFWISLWGRGQVLSVLHVGQFPRRRLRNTALGHTATQEAKNQLSFKKLSGCITLKPVVEVGGPFFLWFGLVYHQSWKQ